MSELAWILLSGLAMSAIALVGAVTLLLDPRTVEWMVPPLVGFAAGSLLGGAFLHMIPAAQAGGMDVTATGAGVLAGFTVFLALEQLLHWHHCGRAGSACRKPLGYLILIGDGLHNFLDGVAVAGATLIDLRLGVSAWLAAAAHEVPQELGDFGVLIHAGWDRRKALLWNVGSAIAFPLGGLLAWFAARSVDVTALVPFAAGNFLYIGASDLVPELARHGNGGATMAHLAAFVAGVLMMALLQRAG